MLICYAHDSEEHKEQVRAFAEFLIGNGIDARMDSWYLDQRRDWQLWATHEIGAADFVLVIASPKCRLVGDGNNAPDEHRGLRSEMNLLREYYHAEPDVWLRRILPVVLPGRSVREIPVFLQPRTADHYFVKEFTVAGADDLLRTLTGQPPYVRPAQGVVPDLPPRTTRSPAPGQSSTVTYSGRTKLEVTRAIGDNWVDLATVLAIPDYDRRRLRAGYEALGVWDWLEIRGRLGDLRQALIDVGRAEVAAALDSTRS